MADNPANPPTARHYMILEWLASLDGAACDEDFIHEFLPTTSWRSPRRTLRQLRCQLVKRGLIWRRGVPHPRRKGGLRRWYGLLNKGREVLKEESCPVTITLMISGSTTDLPPSPSPPAALTVAS